MTMRDRFLGSSFLFRQAPDNPAGGGGGGTTSAPGGGSSSSSSSVPASSASPTPAPSSSSPSPSPTPAPAAPSSEATEGDSGIDFGLFFGDGPSPEPAPTATPTSPPKAPEPAPAPAKPAEPEPAPKPVETKQEPAAAAPSPTGAASAASTSPPLDPSDPGSLARHLVENEEAMVEHVAKTMFKLSDKDMEELETNVGEAIPKLLGRTFVKMQANMLQQVARLVPGMVQRTTEMVQKNAESERKFFEAWPALNPADHGAIVRRYAVTYRQMHPQATFDQMVKELGPLVMMAAQVSPQVPAAPKGATPPKAQPFVPSVPGATVISATPVEEDSALAALDPSRQE